MAFDCLEVAHQAAERIGPIAKAIARHDREMAVQLRRAAASIVNNIDEAAGNAGGRKTEHFRYAFGSAREVCSQLRLARAWGYVEDVAGPLELLDRERQHAIEARERLGALRRGDELARPSLRTNGRTGRTEGRRSGRTAGRPARRKTKRRRSRAAASALVTRT